MTGNSLNRKRDLYKEYFAAFFSLALILNGYASGIGSLSVGMIGFIIFIVFALLKLFESPGINIYQSLPLLFFILLSANTLVQTLSLSGDEFNARNMVFYLVKFGIWAFAAAIMSKCLLDYGLMRKWMNRVALIASCYLLIQYFFMYVLGIVLPSIINIGFLRANYDIYEVSQLGVGGFRPSSFFAEPSFLAAFMLLNIVLLMFEDRQMKKRTALLLFYSAIVLLSTSSGGIYMTVIVWCVFFVHSAKGYWRGLAYVLTGLAIAVGVMFFTSYNWNTINSTSVFGDTMRYSLLKFQTLATSGRVGKSYAYFDLLSTKEWIWGVGVGNEISFITNNQVVTGLYMNSITTLIFWGGIVGAVLFALMNIVLYINANTTARMLIIVYLVYGYFSGMYFSLQGMLYYMVIELLINYGQRNDADSRIKA